MPHKLTPAKSPPPLPVYEIGQVKVKDLDLRKILGEPHYIEHDTTRTSGGIEEHWGFILPSGERIDIAFKVSYGVACWYSNALDIGRNHIAELLGIPGDDPRLWFHPKPFRP